MHTQEEKTYLTAVIKGKNGQVNNGERHLGQRNKIVELIPTRRVWIRRTKMKDATQTAPTQQLHTQEEITGLRASGVGTLRQLIPITHQLFIRCFGMCISLFWFAFVSSR